MCIQSIRLTAPFCNASQEKQTKCSLCARTITVGLGAIALLIGVLILCSIPGLSSLGTIGGSLFSAIGGLTVLAGVCLWCPEKTDQHDSGSLRQMLQQEPPAHFQREKQGAIADEVRNGPQGEVSWDLIEGQNKVGPLDFAKVTPANYQQYLDVSQTLDWEAGKKGDLVFTQRSHKEDFECSWNPRKYKKGDVRLDGCIQHVDRGCYGGAGLEIRNGEFVHYPQMAAPAVHFSNLKIFFDYLFQGDFYQGDCTKDMEFFSLKTVDGKEVRYYRSDKK